MIDRFAMWVVLLFASSGALAAKPAQNSDWKKLATFYHARHVLDTTVLNGRELQIEGVRCRLLGIRLQPGEDNQKDAKRFVERFLQFNNHVLRIANANEPIENKDGAPLVWIESGYGAMLQRNMVQAGLATIDEEGLADFKLYHESYNADARRSAFDWKKILQNAEADFKKGKDVPFGFPWPSPVQTDEAVCSAITARIGKPDKVYTIAGHTYLEYRPFTLTVYQGRVTDVRQSGDWRSFDKLASAIETRLGKPQGTIKIDDRVMFDYNLDNSKTLSLIASSGNVVGVNYTRTEDLRGLVGLEMTVEGKVLSVGKPGACVMTHRGAIYFSGNSPKMVYHFDAERVKVTGVLKYFPPYPGPLPWPPAQLPGQQFYFDTGAALQIKPIKADVSKPSAS